jgi:hypothetical protein
MKGHFIERTTVSPPPPTQSEVPESTNIENLQKKYDRLMIYMYYLKMMTIHTLQIYKIDKTCFVLVCIHYFNMLS